MANICHDDEIAALRTSPYDPVHVGPALMPTKRELDRLWAEAHGGPGSARAAYLPQAGYVGRHRPCLTPDCHLPDGHQGTDRNLHCYQEVNHHYWICPKAKPVVDLIEHLTDSSQQYIRQEGVYWIP